MRTIQDEYRAGLIRCGLASTGIEASEMLRAFVDETHSPQFAENVMRHIDGRGDATWRLAALKVATEGLCRN